ncbi:hypothetical protein DEAC_c08520 [Desulfosporosinus acididurans]|uniref:Uncharacterized protein n=1 Tax=Desulfosporosinus acididurans TaxID=476652 RepID=A0A0J1FVA9_9FIRM|nr:hypothetical protein [Desulfosporosinus acididurans]KLU66918.1 hypothetical protein DEAC_c08520 [Desulfosporosinus acididurans]
MRPMDKKRIATVAGTLVLAGAVVAAGVYGPSVWKVFRQQSTVSDQAVIQNPVVDNTNTPGNNAAASGTGTGTGTGTGPGTGSGSGTGASLPDGGAAPGKATPTVIAPSTINTPAQGDTGSKNKYKEPDTTKIDLAPSVAAYFGDNALSNDAKTLAFGTAWNIHQYVDGYLYGPAAGPQMNEQDIKKYIIFHKTLWDKQLKNEPNASKAAAFTNYFDLLLNTGIDAFDSKDKARIEQFHQGIHDLDSHIFRNDTNSKIYGATPFATKRT